MKKIGRFSGFDFWYVNGYWVRNNLDRQFPNYGGHRNFKFVPKNEFWIDFENGRKEAKFFIDMFLVMERAYDEGKNHGQAVEIANKIERMERDKLKLIKKYKKIKVREEILKKVHKKALFGKYTKKIKVWTVRGHVVRSLFDVDFNQGGHGYVYPFVPKNEIWLDDSLYKKEIPFVLIHELHERKLMAKGWPYDPVGQSIFIRTKNAGTKSAHFDSEKLEFYCRKHPKTTKKTILKEIRENERI